MKNELKDLVSDLAAYVKRLDVDTYQPADVRKPAPSERVRADSGRRTRGHGVRSSSSADLMSALADEIRACRKCPLGNSRLNAVVGVGDPAANVVFVGEGPGFQEDHQG